MSGSLEKPAMGFMYEAMDSTKENIQQIV